MSDIADLLGHYLGVQKGVGISPNNRAFALNNSPESIMAADKYNTLKQVMYLNSQRIPGNQARELMAGLRDRMNTYGPVEKLPYDQYLNLGNTQVPVSNGKIWLY